MTPKKQRLVLVGVAALAMVGAGALAVSALGDTAAYFYAPSDLAKAATPPTGAFRLGGLVEVGSVRREGVTMAFRVTDNAESVPVSYTGIVPDLFREGQGVIAEGRLADGRFVAEQVLAKHDENYMPPEVAGALHKTESVKS